MVIRQPLERSVQEGNRPGDGALSLASAIQNDPLNIVTKPTDTALTVRHRYPNSQDTALARHEPNHWSDVLEAGKQYVNDGKRILEAYLADIRENARTYRFAVQVQKRVARKIPLMLNSWELYDQILQLQQEEEQLRQLKKQAEDSAAKDRSQAPISWENFAPILAHNVIEQRVKMASILTSMKGHKDESHTRICFDDYTSNAQVTAAVAEARRKSPYSDLIPASLQMERAKPVTETVPRSVTPYLASRGVRVSTLEQRTTLFSQLRFFAYEEGHTDSYGEDVRELAQKCLFPSLRNVSTSMYVLGLQQKPLTDETDRDAAKLFRKHVKATERAFLWRLLSEAAKDDVRQMPRAARTLWYTFNVANPSVARSKNRGQQLQYIDSTVKQLNPAGAQILLHYINRDGIRFGADLMQTKEQGFMTALNMIREQTAGIKGRYAKQGLAHYLETQNAAPTYEQIGEIAEHIGAYQKTASAVINSLYKDGVHDREKITAVDGITRQLMQDDLSDLSAKGRHAYIQFLYKSPREHSRKKRERIIAFIERELASPAYSSTHVRYQPSGDGANIPMQATYNGTTVLLYTRATGMRAALPLAS